jgi:hypothetical protein
LTGDDQKKFWISISRRAIFHRAIEPEEWPRANDSDQGAERKKINPAASTENVCKESGTEANDAKDEFVKNEELLLCSYQLSIVGFFQMQTFMILDVPAISH